MNKVIEKIVEVWNKITTFKPKIIETISKIYKASYLLNSILKFAVDAALPLGLDAAMLTKIGGYVTVILQYVEKLSGWLGISLDASFTDEVRALVTTEATPFPKTASKRAKLTINDVVASYDKAFAKLDEILKD
jgi:hypothetical protein